MEFLFPQRRGRDLMAGAVKKTPANRGQTHDVLQCPSASGGYSLCMHRGVYTLDDAGVIVAAKRRPVDALFMGNVLNGFGKGPTSAGPPVPHHPGRLSAAEGPRQGT